MKLLRDVLKIKPGQCVAVIGAGGKTSLMFQIASQFSRAVISTSTHLLGDQGVLADSHVVLLPDALIELSDMRKNDGVTLLTGPLDKQKYRFLAPTHNQLDKILLGCRQYGIPFFIEADGARHRSIKAPDEHEPAIPEFSDTVLLVAGLSVLGKPLSDKIVHRPEIFSRLGGIGLGDAISAESIINVLNHPIGGLKNIPEYATRQIILTQADTLSLLEIGRTISNRTVGKWDRAVVVSLKPNPAEILFAREWVSGIVLAAGKSERYGKPKIHEMYKGKSFIRNVCETAILSLDEVIVVTTPDNLRVEHELEGLPIKIAINTYPDRGQGSSIGVGLEKINPKASGAIFLHADQPQTSPLLLKALRDRAMVEEAKIIAPLIDGQRGNPVYFDHSTFDDLRHLVGDQGGRQIFHRYSLNYVEWLDRKQLLDVDTPEQLRQLLDG